MNKKYIPILESSLKKLGYSLVNLGELRDSGYRPKVINQKGNENNNVQLIPTTDGKLVIIDYACQIQDRMIVDLSTGVEDYEYTISPELIAEIKRNSAEIFKENYEKVKNRKFEDQSHIVATSKKLILKNSFTSGNILYIPFERDGEIVACQTRYGKSKKYSVKGSSLTGSYNILQDGEKCGILGTRVGYISESYTTACEIAEACPKSFVACCAGIDQLYKVFETLNTEYSDITFILVLDKTKDNVINAGQDNLEQKLAKDNIPFIQLSKMDKALAKMTDFNDYALQYGKQRVQHYISHLSAAYSPLPPEIIDQTATDIYVVSRIDGCVHRVKKTPREVLKSADQLAGKAFWDQLFKLYIGSEEECVAEWIKQSLALTSALQPKGIGIFKEEGKIVANLTIGRYVCSEGKLESTVDLKPVGAQIYVNKTLPENQIDLTNDVDINAPMKELFTHWNKVIGESKSSLYGLIGWFFQAAYSTLTEFRCHSWIVGPSGTGKSAIMSNVFPRLFNGVIENTQNVTAAALRQSMTESNGTENANIFIIDELGNDSIEKRKRNKEIIMEARESATATKNSRGIRGSRELSAKVFKKQSSFITASKTHFLDDTQDISRFLIYKMQKRVKTDDIEVFNAFFKACEEANTAIMKILVEQAPHWEKFLKCANKKVPEFLEGRQVYSHMNRTFSYSVAGLAAFIYGAFMKGKEELTDETVAKAVDKAFVAAKDFYDSVLEKHKTECTDGLGYENKFLRFEVKNSIGEEVNLIDYLTEFPDANRKFWKYYGVRLKDGHLEFKENKEQLESFFTHPRNVVKIYDALDMLMELNVQNTVERVSLQMRGDKKRFRQIIYRYKIPEHFYE